MGNKLRELREGQGWTHDQAGKASGMSRSNFIKLERGERKLTQNTLTRIAKAFNVKPSDLLDEVLTVPIVGYVGAGSTIYQIGPEQGEIDRVPAPEGSTEDTVAVEIRGESLGSFFDQWLAYYDEVHNPPTSDMIGRLCVCGLADGRILVKKLMRGSLPGHYTLLSQFEPPIYDAIVEWSARVRRMEPR
jgi:transcriptional regulator with XRE-family HTH domain